jgi:hypothetical protein
MSNSVGLAALDAGFWEVLGLLYFSCVKLFAFFETEFVGT